MRNTISAAFALFTISLLSATACSGDGEKSANGEESGSCPVSTSACIDSCIGMVCGPEISDCSGNATCDAAKDTMVSCVCHAQSPTIDATAVNACLSTFTSQGGPLSTPLSTCAKNNCATACGL